VPYVRVIGPDKAAIGILPVREAIALAARQGLDLVLIAPMADPPVAGIMDFGRYLYEQKAKQKESKKKQHSAEVRDIRMKMKIDTHDYEVKLRKIKEFLANRDRIRVTLFLRGREIVHADLGFKLLERLTHDLDGLGRVDGTPRLFTEGRKSIQMMLVPK